MLVSMGELLEMSTFSRLLFRDTGWDPVIPVVFGLWKCWTSWTELQFSTRVSSICAVSCKLAQLAYRLTLSVVPGALCIVNTFIWKAHTGCPIISFTPLTCDLQHFPERYSLKIWHYYDPNWTRNALHKGTLFCISVYLSWIEEFTKTFSESDIWTEINKGCLIFRGL